MLYTWIENGTKESPIKLANICIQFLHNRVYENNEYHSTFQYFKLLYKVLNDEKQLKLTFLLLPESLCFIKAKAPGLFYPDACGFSSVQFYESLLTTL